MSGPLGCQIDVSPALHTVDGRGWAAAVQIENRGSLDLEAPAAPAQGGEQASFDLARMRADHDVGHALVEYGATGRDEIRFAALNVDMQKIESRVICR